MKKPNQFKLDPQARKALAQMIDGLPEIPYIIDTPNGPAPQRVAVSKHVKGEELLATDSKAVLENGESLAPDKYYIQRTKAIRTQNHKVAIYRAYQKFGMKGAEVYCTQVFDFHRVLNSPPPQPMLELPEQKELETTPNLEL